MKWDDVATSDKYTELAPEKQKVVQDRYFDTYVKADPRFNPELETTLRTRLFGEKEPSVSDTVLSAGKNLLKGAASFFIQTPQIAGSLIKEQGELLSEKPDYTRLVKPEPMDIAFGPTMKIADIVFTKLKSEMAEKTPVDEGITKAGQTLIDANRRFVLRHKIEPDKGPLNQVMFDVGSAGSSVLTSLGLAYLTKSPGAIAPLFGLIQKGQVYQEAREAGKAPKEASTISTMAGIPEAALEYVGLNIFINKLRGLKTLPRIALRAGEQALQEGSQQFSEETIAKVSNLRNTSWPDILKKSAYSAAIGLITGMPAATIATYGENKGILGDMRKAGFTDEEAMPIIEKLIEKQQENIKPEVINTLNEEVKKTDDFTLTPEDVVMMRQELEKSIVIPKDLGIATKEGKPIEIVAQEEEVPVIEDLLGEQGIVAPTAKGGEIAEDRGYRGKVESRIENGKEVFKVTDEEGRFFPESYSTKAEADQARIELAKIELETLDEYVARYEKGTGKKATPEKIEQFRIERENVWKKKSDSTMPSKLSPKEGGGEEEKTGKQLLQDELDKKRPISAGDKKRFNGNIPLIENELRTDLDRHPAAIIANYGFTFYDDIAKLRRYAEQTNHPLVVMAIDGDIEGLEKAVKQPTQKKVKKLTQISPATPATQIIDKKILSLISHLNGISQKEYGKPFSELKTAEKKNIFTRSDKFGVVETPMSEEEALNISAIKTTSTDWEESRAPFASYKFDVATDGRYLIIDKKVAKEIKDEYWAKQYKKIAKDMIREKGLSTIKAEEFAKTEVKRRQNEDYQFPKTKEIIDNASDNDVNLDFIGLRSADGYSVAMYSDGKQWYPLSMDYVKLMKKYFPNAEMKADKNNNQPISFVENGELKGVLMPMSIDFIGGETSLPKKLSQPSTPSGSAMATPMWHNEIPIEQGTEYYKLKSFETPELVRLVREVMGSYPEVVRKTGKAAGRFIGKPGYTGIKLVADLFKQGNEQELGIVIAHEFGHLTDWLPDETLKRGNLLGRLMSLRSFLKQTFGEGNEEISNKEIKSELIAVTKYMHPFDEKTVPPAYKTYRLSSRELYAEAISLLLNSPGTMEKMAPKFTKSFFENIDKKPEVKQAYFDLLELLNGERIEVIAELDKDIRRMFAQADPLRTQKLTEKKVATVSTFDKIRQHLDNKYHMLNKKIQNLEKQGIPVSAEQNPKYILEEYAMSNNAVYDWLLGMDKEIKNPLTEAGIEQTDFGTYLFLKRIIGSPNLQGEETEQFDDIDKDTLGEMIDASTGKPFKEEFTDRKNIANPLGIQPRRAEEQLAYLKTKIGEEKFAKLEQFAQKFHNLVFSVVEQAVKVGSYNSKVFAERILPNKNTYVSFGVVNYMQNFVSAGVKKQIGTLNEIENPFITTIMKTISLIKLNEKQRAMNSVRNLLQTHFSSEITQSKKHKTTGGGVDWTETPGSFKLLEDGRMVSYEIDPYIARSLKYDPYAGEIGNLLNTILGNRIFKDIVITYNPGFALAFNPIRDFKRTYKSLNALGQRVSLLKLLIEYVKAMPSSYRRLQGIDDNTIREMIQNRALDIPFSDFHAADYEDSNTAYNELLKKYKLAKTPSELSSMRRAILKPVISVLEFLRFHGSALESVSKIAGYNILKSRDVAPMERAFQTRTYIGTPNFRNKGLSTEMTNAIFIFSNIMKEGLKADTTLAINPKTRSGYWWSTAKVDLFPKLLMVLAAAGLFGEPLKRLFDKASEYDKTNYIIVPLGEINGKAVYARLPHDESGRLISAIFWKVAQALQGKPEQIQQIFAFGAGQMPQLTPMLSIGTGWIQYLSGNNPYEPFRGGTVLTDTEYKAGGGAALNKMVGWTAGEFGLSQFATYNPDTNSTFESTIQLTPLVNRLVRVSDAGISQDLRQIKKEVEREQARTTLLKRDEFKKGVERVEKGADPTTVLRDIKKSVYGSEKIDNQKAGVLVKGFLRAYLKKEKDSPYVDAMIYSTSNAEKKQIIARMRKSMELSDFKKQIKVLYKFRVITDKTMSMDEWKELLK